MDAIISMQDIRTRLGTIAQQTEKGASFTVIRNSKPAFRIVPFASPGTQATTQKPTMTLKEIRERFEANPVTPDELTRKDLDKIIHEVHCS